MRWCTPPGTGRAPPRSSAGCLPALHKHKTNAASVTRDVSISATESVHAPPGPAQRTQAGPRSPSLLGVASLQLASPRAASRARVAVVSYHRTHVSPLQARAAPPGAASQQQQREDKQRPRRCVRTKRSHRDVAHHQRRLRLREHLGSCRRGVGPGLALEADGSENLIQRGRTAGACCQAVLDRPARRRAAQCPGSPRQVTSLPPKPPRGDRRGPRRGVG